MSAVPHTGHDCTESYSEDLCVKLLDLGPFHDCKYNCQIFIMALVQEKWPARLVGTTPDFSFTGKYICQLYWRIHELRCKMKMGGRE